LSTRTTQGIPTELAQRLVIHLAEIAAGRSTLNDKAIADEPDESAREILVGLLLLDEDLNLERTLHERAIEERQLALSQLKEALAGRDAFLIVAAHELRTPITTLRLDLESLKRGLPQRSNDESWFLRAQARLERQVRRLGRLVEELLDVAQISSNRLRICPERVDLTQLASEAVERFSTETAKVKLKGVGPLWGVWDPLRVDQVLTNLLSNAARYGLGQPIEVCVEQRGEYAVIAVRDHGAGIPVPMQERIFERFSSTSSKASNGLGLGLWIVRSLVAAMGGQVSVTSAPGEGATFTVVLPLMPPVESEGARDATLTR
jgi:signal transduction histidine kinase